MCLPNTIFYLKKNTSAIILALPTLQGNYFRGYIWPILKNFNNIFNIISLLFEAIKKEPAVASSVLFL